MEPRLLAAYALMLVLALAGAALALYFWYNSHPRTAERQRVRDHRRHEARRVAPQQSPASDSE